LVDIHFNRFSWRNAPFDQIVGAAEAELSR